MISHINKKYPQILAVALCLIFCRAYAQDMIVENVPLSEDKWLRITERYLSFIPDVSGKETDVYVSYDDIDWLMDYARLNLMERQCMAIYLETVSLPNPGVYFLLRVFKVMSYPSGGDIESETFSTKGIKFKDGVQANPANSICKNLEGGVELAYIMLEISEEQGCMTLEGAPELGCIKSGKYDIDFFAKKVVGNMRSYSANYNARTSGAYQLSNQPLFGQNKSEENPHHTRQ